MTNNRAVVDACIPDVAIDFMDVGNLPAGKRYDLAIIDIPGPGTLQPRNLHRVAGFIACIDDEGAGLPQQDVLIRPNLIELPKPQGVSCDNYWAGGDYIILHPQFGDLFISGRKKKRSARDLLVCFGGSDPARLTLRVIPILKQLGGFIRARIVIGASFPCKADIFSAISADPRFRVHQNVANMAEALQNSDVALISGGTLLYEACAMGVPSIIISQNTAQDREASICHAKGAVINVGRYNTVPDADIMSALNEVMKKPALRERLTQKSNRVVAVDASQRIAAQLMSSMKEKTLQ